MDTDSLRAAMATRTDMPDAMMRWEAWRDARNTADAIAQALGRLDDPTHTIVSREMEMRVIDEVSDLVDRLELDLIALRDAVRAGRS